MPESKIATPSLREANQQIELAGTVALDILREVEFMLISLRKISDHHLYQPMANFDKTVADFVFDAQLPRRLAKMRHLLSEPFDDSLGPDDLDDIERHLLGLAFWQAD